MRHPEPVELNARVEKTCRLLSPLAEKANVTLETQLGAASLVACGKENADQILWNLIENAIKYNLPGGRVTIATQQQGDKVQITVADTGVGIPEESLSRIFERFYRVDKARSREAGGTGLGLSIVRDTVRLYGGSITAAPGAEGGMVFTVVLPLWQEEGEEP